MSLSALFCISIAACANGLVPGPLPVWQNAYTEHLDRIPKDQTQFITADQLDIVFVLTDDAGRKSIKTLSLNKRIAPRIKAKVNRTGDRTYQYLYTVSNDRKAQDGILRFEIVIPAGYDGLHATTDGEIGGPQWGGGISIPAIAPQCELTSAERGRLASWVGTHELTYLIAPGQSRSGLGLKTTFLPGFTTGYVGGPFVSIPESWGVDAADCGDFATMMVHIPTLGPMFPNGTACPDILANYQQGLSRLLQCGVPKNDEKALVALLTEINKSGSKCEELSSNLRDKRMPESEIASDVLKALLLALETGK
jgi:hypothetical protein